MGPRGIKAVLPDESVVPLSAPAPPWETVAAPPDGGGDDAEPTIQRAFAPACPMKYGFFRFFSESTNQAISYLPRLFGGR